MQRRNFIRAAATAGAVAWVSPMHRIFSAAVRANVSEPGTIYHQS